MFLMHKLISVIGKNKRMSFIKIINIEEFKSEIFDFTKNKEFVFTKEKPIILNFFATWCGPCHQFAPALESIAQQHHPILQVFKIDIDTHPEIPHLFDVQSVPATVFFAPNCEPALVMGNIGDAGLARAVDQLFGLK
jgi:thioredoxin-like negative regulator of GroEL